MATTSGSSAPPSEAAGGNGSGPYEVGRRYRVTEVLGWWLREPSEPPAWTPVLGPLHQDLEHFEVAEHHYHVDPRFIDEESEERARQATNRRLIFTDDGWHRAYRIVLTTFPVPESEDQYFVVKNLYTGVYERDDGRQVTRRPKPWGLKRVKLRRRRLECLRQIPPVEISPDEMNIGFHELHAAYPDACGDICPHRGYDLRNIAIGQDGYRRCPIHQLRVKAPTATRACEQQARTTATVGPAAQKPATPTTERGHHDGSTH